MEQCAGAEYEEMVDNDHDNIYRDMENDDADTVDTADSLAHRFNWTWYTSNISPYYGYYFKP